MESDKSAILERILQSLLAYCKESDLKNAAFDVWLESAKLKPQFDKWFQAEIQTSDPSPGFSR